MKVCVFGAGAVGGHLAVRLAAAGNAVTVIAREPTVAAINARGLTLKTPAGPISTRPRAYTDSRDAGPQDVVIVTVKSNATPTVVEGLAPLLGPETPVVFVVNGIPWWYGHGLPKGRHPLPDLGFLDPGGKLAETLGMKRVIGSVIYSGNEVIEPAVIVNHSVGASQLVLGELDGSASARVKALADLLESAGFKSPVSEDIRKAVWTKLVASNLAALPICTLLNQPLAVFGKNPELLALYREILREGMAVAAAHGFALDIDLEQATNPERLKSPHRPSMVQDFERERPLELDGILIAAQRFARAANVPTPNYDAVMALLVQRAVDAGLYKR